MKDRYRKVSVFLCAYLCYRLNLYVMVCEKREARVVRGNKVSRLGAYLIRENREAEGDEEIGSASLFVAEDLQVTKYPPLIVFRSPNTEVKLVRR